MIPGATPPGPAGDSTDLARLRQGLPCSWLRGLIAETLGHDRIAELGGIGRALPMTVIAFGLAGLSLMGVPPSGGFVAKWLMLTASAMEGQWWWALVILVGGLLAGAYVFRVLARSDERCERIDHGLRATVPRPREAVPGARDLGAAARPAAAAARWACCDRLSRGAGRPFAMTDAGPLPAATTLITAALGLPLILLFCLPVAAHEVADTVITAGMAPIPALQPQCWRTARSVLLPVSSARRRARYARRDAAWRRRGALDCGR